MKVFNRGMILSLAILGVGASAGSAPAAVFTVNIFNLKNRLRNGVTVTVTVAAVDADNNVVADSSVNFDGDKDAAGALVISTQKNVTTGRTVVTVNDSRVSAVTFTFTGNGLMRTTVQRLRNKNNLEYDVAVPDDLTPPDCVQCPLFCFEQQQYCRWFSRRCRR